MRAGPGPSPGLPAHSAWTCSASRSRGSPSSSSTIPSSVLLDEASAAALSGEMDDLDAISGACCAMIDACKQVHDFDRASQWCDQVTQFCERWSDQITFAACRAHYADILIWRGAWADAETLLLANLGPLAAIHPTRLADSLVRLAELRRRQGRLADVAGLLAQSQAHRRAPLVGAALALDRGDPAALTFGLFDGTLEELRAIQTRYRDEAPASRVAQYVDEVLLDGAYEVLEEVTP